MKIKTNHRVSTYDESKPSVTVVGVGELFADLVIAADGKDGVSGCPNETHVDRDQIARTTTYQWPTGWRAHSNWLRGLPSNS